MAKTPEEKLTQSVESLISSLEKQDANISKTEMRNQKSTSSVDGMSAKSLANLVKLQGKLYKMDSDDSKRKSKVDKKLYGDTVSKDMFNMYKFGSKFFEMSVKGIKTNGSLARLQFAEMKKSNQIFKTESNYLKANAEEAKQNNGIFGKLLEINQNQLDFVKKDSESKRRKDVRGSGKPEKANLKQVGGDKLVSKFGVWKVLLVAMIAGFLGILAIFAGLKQKVGKWTGTLKLLGKTLLGISKFLFEVVFDSFKKWFNRVAAILRKLHIVDIKKLLRGVVDTLKTKILGFLVSAKNFVVDFFKGIFAKVMNFFGKGGAKIGGGIGAKLGGGFLKGALGKFLTFALKAVKKIPLLGNLISIGFAIKRFIDGDIFGGLLELASALAGLLNLIPGVGTFLAIAVSMGIDIFLAKRDMDKAAGKPPSGIEKMFDKFMNWIGDKIIFIPVIGPLIKIGKSIAMLKSDVPGGILGIIQGIGSLVPFVGPLLMTGVGFLFEKAKSADASLKKTTGKGLFSTIIDAIKGFVFKIPLVQAAVGIYEAFKKKDWRGVLLGVGKLMVLGGPFGLIANLFVAGARAADSAVKKKTGKGLFSTIIDAVKGFVFKIPLVQAAVGIYQSFKKKDWKGVLLGIGNLMVLGGPFGLIANLFVMGAKSANAAVKGKTGKGILDYLTDFIKDKFPSLFKVGEAVMKGDFMGALKGFGDMLPWMNAVVSFFDNGVTNVKAAGGKAFDFAKEIGDKLWTTIKDVFDGIFDEIKDMMKGFKKKMSGMLPGWAKKLMGIGGSDSDIKDAKKEEQEMAKKAKAGEKGAAEAYKAKYGVDVGGDQTAIMAKIAEELGVDKEKVMSVKDAVILPRGEKRVITDKSDIVAAFKKGGAVANALGGSGENVGMGELIDFLKQMNMTINMTIDGKTKTTVIPLFSQQRTDISIPQIPEVARNNQMG